MSTASRTALATPTRARRHGPGKRAPGRPPQPAASRAPETRTADGHSPSAASAPGYGQEILERVLRQACQILDVEVATIFARDDGDPRTMRVAAARGTGPKTLGRLIGVDEGIAGRVIATGETAVLEDYETYASPLPAEFVGEAIHATASAPIAWGGQVRGAITVASRDAERRFGEVELGLLTDLAELAATALEHATMRRQLEEGLGAGVEALGALLDLRDGYTAEHSGQVGELALEVGRRLGVSDTDLFDLATAARLHDIGKVGVPDRILRKPGPLSDDEWTVMRRHPEWGADTLAHIPGLESVAAIVRFHHERWDGKGYPDGIKGDRIPLASRLIAVCDAYWAMLSDRPYRHALPPARAIAELQAGAGTQFDPDVVDALVAAIKDGAIPAPPSRDEAEPSPGAPEAPRSAARRAGHRPYHALPEAFRRMEALPALSESRDRLLEALAKPEVSMADIATTVESDIALTIAVLRVANRDRGPESRKVADIPSAVEALSPEGIEALARRIAAFDFFQRVSGWDLPPERFRLHAVATQRAAARLARAIGRDNHEELLVAALLHDVGKLVLMEAYERYPNGVHGSASTPEERLQAERRELGLDHALAGGVLVRRWGLPERLAATVERHHAPDADGDAAMVRLADMLARYGHGRSVDPSQMLLVARRVGLDAKALRAVMYELPEGSEEIRRPAEPSPLTPAEHRALRGLSDGKVYKQIAADLGIAVSTVRTHLHNAYRKLGAADRAQAVLIATEREWI